MNNLYKSIFESDFFGLNIYRNTSTEDLDTFSLQKFILENKVDVIRLKTDVKHQHYFNSNISNVSFPYFFSHTILYVKAEYTTEKINDYNNQDISFEVYDDSKEEQRMRFHNLVYKGMFQEPIGYFKTPMLLELISNEKEALCYATYYTKYYGGIDEKKIGFIMQKNGSDAAVFVFEIDDKGIHTSMAAILPEYRSARIFHDLKVFRQKFCLQNGIQNAYTGFRVSNFHTPNVLLKHGYKITGAENVFHLLPFCSYNKISNFPIPQNELSIDALSNILKKYLFDNYQISHTYNSTTNISGLPFSCLFKVVHINIPVCTNKLQLFVVNYLIYGTQHLGYICFIQN